MPRLKLFPGGKILEAPDGASLRDALFGEGIEFPCGGLGLCRRCKVRVLGGNWAVSPADSRLLSAAEIRDGWRLSCQGAITENVTIEVAQWDSGILSDETAFDFTPSEGLGIAIDLGTTTIAAQLLDLRSASILAVTTALNAQGVVGADVMTRLDFAVNGGASKLTELIRKQLHEVVKTLIVTSGRNASDVRRVVVVGNTAMHHLFCELPIDSLARDAFEPFSVAPQLFSGADLNWDFENLRLSFLPPIGGFVGSDILAGVVATRLHKSDGPAALIDLGTNGEVVVAVGDDILCASTAAGPAFEGARISSGMRAARGAIHSVRLRGNEIHCEVLGGARPRGICGSGLVDAISTGLDAKIIQPSGRLTNGGQSWLLAEPIALQQKDVRELQLAKGAIAGGLIILHQELGASLESIERVYLAGAFGNYVNRESACRIGLIPVSPDKVVQAGNTALLGAKLALFADYQGEFESLHRQIRHVPLNERADFQEIFLEQIHFPRQASTHQEVLTPLSKQEVGIAKSE